MFIKNVVLCLLFSNSSIYSTGNAQEIAMDLKSRYSECLKPEYWKKQKLRSEPYLVYYGVFQYLLYLSDKTSNTDKKLQLMTECKTKYYELTGRHLAQEI